ncbi:MAG TPA: hypothetical protein VF335_04565, partial [Chitinivibrionales bacterium]
NSFSRSVYIIQGVMMSLLKHPANPILLVDVCFFKAPNKQKEDFPLKNPEIFLFYYFDDLYVFAANTISTSPSGISCRF